MGVAVEAGVGVDGRGVAVGAGTVGGTGEGEGRGSVRGVAASEGGAAPMAQAARPGAMAPARVRTARLFMEESLVEGGVGLEVLLADVGDEGGVLLVRASGRADLVHDHLGKGGHLAFGEVTGGVPEPGAEEAAGALEVGLLDVDEDAHLGDLAVDGERLEQRGLGDDLCSAVETEGFVDAGDEEEGADVRVLQDVEKGVDALIARALG